MQITVVVPSYNEVENLERLVSTLFDLPLADLQLLIVDDNSPDGTGELADKLVDFYNGRLAVLHRPGKAGLGTAYIQGFNLALTRGAEAIAQMDADFSHPPETEAVAVKYGKFMEVGSAKDIEKFVGKRTRVVDLGGSFAMPGFNDGHIHPAQPYLREEGGALLFPESFNKQQIAEAVAAYLKKNPNAPYVVGEKWGMGLFPKGRANKQWLDSLVSDRPAILRDESRHGAVANTAMLKFAGITKDTPQPAYGLIEKHPQTGEPTGYLAETAMQAVFSKIPMYPDEVWERP